ncbi:MAG TPA: ABC transporter ATP-binding protein [Solirubrobacteraceae bacterium]|nr:ABC transporter ATP-binding protein [Solirubrobacteraceae bacterium]
MSAVETSGAPSRLEVRGLHVWFDVGGGELHAVQGVDLDVPAGERIGLVGESGCGKTTLMMAMMGLLPPSATVAGEIRLDGRDLLAGGENSMAAHRWTDIALVFQGAMNALNPVKRIAWQITEPMLVHHTADRAGARRRAIELLELVGLPARTASLYPHELSGGMRQRVAVAMALACRPRILLADEPTTALDVMVQAQLLELLTSLSAELGLALVLVTHDLPIVIETCQRAAVMYAGRIAEEGPIARLTAAPAHPYTRMLLAATPDLDDDRPTRSIDGSPPRLDQPIVGCSFRDRCDRVGNRCATELPLLRPVQDGGGRQLAACHHPGPPSDDPGEAQAISAAGGGLHPAGGDGHPIAEVRELHASFPVRRGVLGTLLRRPRRVAHAVDGVSLTLAPGELLALVGESGSGKTTTAQTMLGNVAMDAGSVTLGGVDIATVGRAGHKALRREVQIVYQDPYEALDPRLRVRQLVAEPLQVHHIARSRGDRAARVAAALTQVGLTPVDLYLERYPHQLSGGQRQRVAIAAGLVLEPKLLIADEPVSMLDVSMRAGILNLLDGLRRDGDLAVLMITHDLSTVIHHADRVAVMYGGRIVEQGPTREVVGDPRHPYTAALLSVVPSRHGSGDRERTLLSGEPPSPVSLPSGCHFHPRCPVATSECGHVDPSERPVGDGEHTVSCLLA